MKQSLIGRKFNKLTVISEASKNKRNQTMWLCRCDCGNEVVVVSGHLKDGHTKSCGCYNIEAIKQRATKHGGSNSRLYLIWGSMNSRCNNQNVKGYRRYGGRGITVCDEWKDYSVFQAWANSSGYDPNAPRGACTLDRINNLGNYDPNNCKWRTAKEQNRNTRANHIVKYDGREMCVAEAAEIAGLPYYLVSERIVRLGWSVSKALSTPIARTVDVGLSI